jgi:hypothetical protein
MSRSETLGCSGIRPSCSNKYLTGHRLCCPTRSEVHSNLNNNPTYTERTMPNSARAFSNIVTGILPNTFSLDFPALGSPTRQATSSRSVAPPAASSNAWARRTAQRNARTQSEIHRTSSVSRTSVPRTPGNLFHPRFQLSFANGSTSQIRQAQVQASEEQTPEPEDPEPSPEASTPSNVSTNLPGPFMNRAQADQYFHSQVALPLTRNTSLPTGRQTTGADGPIPQSSGTQVQQSRQQTPEYEVSRPLARPQTPPAMLASQHAPSNDRSHFEGSSVDRPDEQQVLQMGNEQVTVFRPGDILWLMIHAPNTNPKLTPKDTCLSVTKNGEIYSKPRPVIVFRIFHRHMECLLMYTHRGTGLSQKSEPERKERVRVVNSSEKQQMLSGDIYLPLVAKADEGKPDMDPQSVVHITASMDIWSAKDVEKIGSIESSSFQRLHSLRASLDSNAQRENCEWTFYWPSS